MRLLKTSRRGVVVTQAQTVPLRVWHRHQGRGRTQQLGETQQCHPKHHWLKEEKTVVPTPRRCQRGERLSRPCRPKNNHVKSINRHPPLKANSNAFIAPGDSNRYITQVELSLRLQGAKLTSFFFFPFCFLFLRGSNVSSCSATTETPG